MKCRMVAIIAMLCLLASQASGQTAKSKEYKDPKTATTWGYLLPGAGHIYAGEQGKGWLLMGTSVGALSAGLAMTLTSGGDSDIPNTFDPYDESPRSYGSADDLQDWTPAYVGLGVFSLGWIYSMVDAGKAAERTNRKHGLSWLKPVRVVPYVAGKADQREWGVRVKVAL